MRIELLSPEAVEVHAGLQFHNAVDIVENGGCQEGIVMRVIAGIAEQGAVRLEDPYFGGTAKLWNRAWRKESVALNPSGFRV